MFGWIVINARTTGTAGVSPAEARSARSCWAEMLAGVNSQTKMDLHSPQGCRNGPWPCVRASRLSERDARGPSKEDAASQIIGWYYREFRIRTLSPR